MPEIQNIVKVFLASPGDLKEERYAAKVATEEFNRLWSDELGYRVELVGWEDTTSQAGRPQEIINRDLDQCELFVGMLWKRWGTPPDNEGRFTSGFEEEFEISAEKRKKLAKPEMSLLFKDVEQEMLNDPGPELKKVLTFKDRISSEREILYDTFGDVPVFERKLTRIITTYVKKLRKEEKGRLSEQSQAPRLDEANNADAAIPKAAGDPILSREGAEFVRTLLNKTEEDVAEQPLTRFEVSRFRLLGSVLSAHGNDSVTLGVHDANTLFTKRDHISFSSKEKMGLISSGFKNFTSENTPLWHWLLSIDAFKQGVIPTYALLENSDTRKIGALNAMTLIREPVTPAGNLSRDSYISNWLHDDAEKTVKVAALGYLAECGLAEDLPKIRVELDRGDYQTTRSATNAIIRIKSRDSKVDAIETLYELQPEYIDEELVADLFGDGRSLNDELLVKGLNHRSQVVRRLVVSILFGRGKLSSDASTPLLEDKDASVRYNALQACLKDGQKFSDEEIKSTLVKKNTNTTLAALSGSDKDGERNWNLYRFERYKTLPIADLEEKARNCSLYDLDAYFALCDRLFSTKGDELRQLVDDHCRKVFKEKLVRLELLAKLAQQSEFLEQVRGLEDFVTKNHTCAALEIVCRKLQATDLGLVRKLLASEFVTYSDSHIEYLQKFGEWRDVPLMINAVQRPEYGRTPLLFSNERRYSTTAKAMVQIGSNRLTELIALEMPSDLLTQVIVHSANKMWSGLADSDILRLMHSESEKVRKAVTIKSARTLSKSRLKRLLGKYTEDGIPYFYNVVYWLDFAISVPKSRVIQAAQRVIFTMTE